MTDRKGIPHRSETMRKAFGFSLFAWYVRAPIEGKIRYLLFRLRHR